MLCFSDSVPQEQEIAITFSLPTISTTVYHRPYVSIWLETTERRGIQTLSVWSADPEWLRDLRQWWRKLGHKSLEKLDGISGATRKPGKYIIHSKIRRDDGEPLPPGKYLLNFEVVREEGGREYLRQEIVIGSTESQQWILHGKTEIGGITISIPASQSEHQ